MQANCARMGVGIVGIGTRAVPEVGEQLAALHELEEHVQTVLVLERGRELEDERMVGPGRAEKGKKEGRKRENRERSQTENWKLGLYHSHTHSYIRHTHSHTSTYSQMRSEMRGAQLTWPA